MDYRFQAIIEAVVEQAKAERSLLWADEVAERIVDWTPLSVRAADISEQISELAANVGVAVTVNKRRQAASSANCGHVSA
jgi:hypothetical protein